MHPEPRLDREGAPGVRRTTSRPRRPTAPRRLRCCLGRPASLPITGGACAPRAGQAARHSPPAPPRPLGRSITARSRPVEAGHGSQCGRSWCERGPRVKLGYDRRSRTATAPLRHACGLRSGSCLLGVDDRLVQLSTNTVSIDRCVPHKVDGSAARTGERPCSSGADLVHHRPADPCPWGVDPCPRPSGRCPVVTGGQSGGDGMSSVSCRFARRPRQILAACSTTMLRGHLAPDDLAGMPTTSGAAQDGVGCPRRARCRPDQLRRLAGLEDAVGRVGRTPQDPCP